MLELVIVKNVELQDMVQAMLVSIDFVEVELLQVIHPFAWLRCMSRLEETVTECHYQTTTILAAQIYSNRYTVDLHLFSCRLFTAHLF